jgi:hypothetical protein
MKNKKANMDYYNSGPEYVFVFLVVISGILGLIIRNILINYIVMFLFGIIIGIQYYNHKFKRSYILSMLTIGLFLGYAIASFHTNWKILLIIYIIGGLLGYYIKEYNWID